MVERGRDLGVDLYELHCLATQDLPEVVEQYDIAWVGLLNAPANPQVFARPEVFGGQHGTMYQPWADLCADIRGCVSWSAAGLRDTAAVLLLAVDTYARADDEARDELDRLRDAQPQASPRSTGAGART